MKKEEDREEEEEVPLERGADSKVEMAMAEALVPAVVRELRTMEANVGVVTGQTVVTVVGTVVKELAPVEVPEPSARNPVLMVAMIVGTIAVFAGAQWTMVAAIPLVERSLARYVVSRGLGRAAAQSGGSRGNFVESFVKQLGVAVGAGLRFGKRGGELTGDYGVDSLVYGPGGVRGPYDPRPW